MQPATGSPRDALTAAQITALIEAENLTVSAGLELLDADDAYVMDLSDDLLDGEIGHGNYQTIHGTCRLSVSRELQWGSARVRPYMTLTDGAVEARFNLGVYLLSTPATVVGESPATYEVDGFDKLEILRHPHGTYRAASGSAYLTLVNTLITDAGESKIRIDQTAAATTLPADRIWPLDEQTSTLNIVNDLLAAVGYRGLWVDWDGYYRSEPYVSPAGRASEWTYDAQSASTTVSETRTSEADYFDVPNHWTFIRSDPAQALPTDGAGIYVVENPDDGPTSQTARGRTIKTIIRLDAASQTALVTQGDAIVEDAKRFVRHVRLGAGPNPLHWHFDVFHLSDSDMAADHDYVVIDWLLPLTGGDMTINARRVS